MLIIQRFFPYQIQLFQSSVPQCKDSMGIWWVLQNTGWREQSPVSLAMVQCPCAGVLPRLFQCPLWALGSRTWAHVVTNRNQGVPQAAEGLCSSAQMAEPAQHLPGALWEGWKLSLGSFQTSHSESPQWAPLQCILLQMHRFTRVALIQEKKINI